MSAAILSDFGPTGLNWVNCSDPYWGEPTQYGAHKMTKEAKKEWARFLASHTPEESHENYFMNYMGDLIEVFNRGPERYGRWVENRSSKGLAADLTIFQYQPPSPPAKPSGPMPPEHVPSIREAAISGIINALLNRASFIGQSFDSRSKAISESFNNSTNGSLGNIANITGHTARLFLDALFGPDVPLPEEPVGPPPASFPLIIKIGQGISDGIDPGMTNETFDFGDPPAGGGGGGGGGDAPRATLPVTFSDLPNYLSTANRLAQLLYGALSPAKSLMSRLDFISNLAGAVGAIAKTLGSTVDLAKTILDMLKDPEGEDLTGQLLEDAIEALTPMLSEIIESIITEVFKKVRELYEKNDSSDKNTKKDKTEIDADSLRDVFNDYFISSQDFNVADTLHAMSSMPSLGSYEIEY